MRPDPSLRRSSLALLAALTLLVVSAVAAPVGAAGGGRSERDRILAYWTPARLQSAVPRDFVKADHGFVPKARPGGGGTGAITGASWTKGGAILKASGKVFFSMDGGNWVCSGSVVTDNRTGASIVLTAGHCAYDETAGGDLDGFATNWVFIPEYDTNPTRTCQNSRWGCWTADALVVHQGFATAGGFNDQATVHDFAFAVVGPGGTSGTAQLDSTVGSFPIAIDQNNVGQKLYAFGYPAAGKYHGADLVYCAGNVFTDDLNDNDTWGMVCGMTGGSSGGPWLSGFNEASGAGTLASLNSYGYSGIKNMYGPKFNSDTADVLAAANGSNGATDNTIVP